MCGITGFVCAKHEFEEAKKTLKAMADLIAHRGPDGAGSYFGDGVALGHRRLSIIDIEGGRQPMFNEDKNLVTVFNGEIYNFMELRAQLQAAGHTFASDHSDTEVLLHGYEEWGEGLLEKLKPSCVIAVDALACSDISRLGTTIQLSDSGISPGSGVANKRKELSEATLGIPVIAAGVPTVVDMYTIVEGMTGRRAVTEVPNMMVTPRDVDRLIERSSALISMGINLALHPELSFEDVETIMF